MPELVTGATGYVGGRLVERLLREGRQVRVLARNPSRLEAPPEVMAVKGDLVTGRGLDRALDGCDVAYYLVHSMEPAAGADGELLRLEAMMAMAAIATTVPAVIPPISRLRRRRRASW